MLLIILIIAMCSQILASKSGQITQQNQQISAAAARQQMELQAKAAALNQMNSNNLGGYTKSTADAETSNLYSTMLIQEYSKHHPTANEIARLTRERLQAEREAKNTSPIPVSSPSSTIKPLPSCERVCDFTVPMDTTDNGFWCTFIKRRRQKRADEENEPTEGECQESGAEAQPEIPPVTRQEALAGFAAFKRYAQVNSADSKVHDMVDKFDDFLYQDGKEKERKAPENHTFL
ncbi:hypothetical protein Ddc_16436 [Ditylenchus destructor]|nr:hypothetical protein Ddc_16436 [Ditylenchus destructor]